MASVFQTNEISQYGLLLIAQATSANPIVFVDSKSASQIPQDPEEAQYYNGIDGTIDASSATDATARVVARFGNTSTSESQVVKAIAIRARLASQSDSDAVIFAYSYDNDSAIYFPSNTAPAQRTRFAFAFDFSQTQSVSVTEAGSASLADLERLVSCHKAGNPNEGVEQTILGDKTWEDQQDFNEACRFHDTMVTHNVYPETNNLYSLGSQNSKYKALYGVTVHSSYVETQQVDASDITVGDVDARNISADDLSVWSLNVGVQDGDAVVTLAGSTITGWKSGSGTYDNQYSYNLLIGGGLAETTGYDHGVLNITPQAVHVDASSGDVTYPGVKVNVGTTEYPLKSVCTQELILRTTANANNNASIMYGEGGIMMHADIMPAHDTRATAEDCGRYQRPWNQLYVRDAITFVMDNTAEAQCITFYEDEGDLFLSNGHDIHLGNTWGNPGALYGAPMGVCSESHSPTTMPNSTSHADAPTWDIEKGTIVMAMPCWATARSEFMNRKGAGDRVTVTFPNVAQAPFQHGNSYDTDPEKGAWYIASWQYGSGSGAKSGFIPVSTLDSATDRELFSYLPAGQYRLLSCVEDCTAVGYSDYHPEGMCVLLQKIS